MPAHKTVKIHSIWAYKSILIWQHDVCASHIYMQVRKILQQVWQDFQQIMQTLDRITGLAHKNRMPGTVFILPFIHMMVKSFTQYFIAEIIIYIWIYSLYTCLIPVCPADYMPDFLECLYLVISSMYKITLLFFNRSKTLYFHCQILLGDVCKIVVGVYGNQSLYINDCPFNHAQFFSRTDHSKRMWVFSSPDMYKIWLEIL